MPFLISFQLNDWALCCIYEHINAEEKKKRKERAASSSIAQNIHSEDIDHDQSPLRKRREVEAVSKDEETPLYLDIFDQYEETSHCLDIFDQWKEEDAKLLQTSSEELSELLELKPPIQGIPSSTAQVCPSLGHPMSSITGENMNEGQNHGVDPSSFNCPDHIPSSISQGSSLWAPPGPHLTSPITGGDMNQGDPRAYAVDLSSSNGPDRIPSSILQGSRLWAPPGPHLTSSISGGDVRPALW